MVEIYHTPLYLASGEIARWSAREVFMNNQLQTSTGGQFHFYDVKLATRLKSLDQAALAAHFQYWIKYNAALGRNFHDGRTWSYQTIKEIAAHFPYWTEKQVRLLLEKLVENKVLRRGNYNENAYDRTAWYSFEDEAYFEILRDICPNGQMEKPNRANGLDQKGTPIPDIIPYRKEKKKKKREHCSGIEFDHESQQFINISEADKSEWLKLYPGVDIDRELIRMRQWLIDPKNPERDGHRTFITRWLDKSFEDSKKKPKKQESPPKDEFKNIIPYHSAIAARYKEKGEEEYVRYLQNVTDQSHYQNYLKSKTRNDQ
jgi:hypothetical protein